MPAQKAHRRSVKRNARNMSARRATRTAVSRARQAVAAADPDSEEAVRNAMSMLDVAVRKGLLHKNNASRRKGRLVSALNRSRAG
ncbi:MAG: 30S ribosomal protein S20 [Chloroflexi bacterium]|nr:30S ribosomal protein S20 [Chloroflexota bacterium]